MGNMDYEFLIFKHIYISFIISLKRFSLCWPFFGRELWANTLKRKYKEKLYIFSYIFFILLLSWSCCEVFLSSAWALLFFLFINMGPADRKTTTPKKKTKKKNTKEKMKEM